MQRPLWQNAGRNTMTARHFLLVVGALFATAAGSVHAHLPDEEVILKSGGRDAEVLIEKAWALLTTAEVFATRAVWEGGDPPTTCWALTVIVRHDARAKERLNELFARTQVPEKKLYAMAGLLYLDAAEKARFTPELLAPLADLPVQTQSGCVGGESTFATEAASLQEHGTAPYIFEHLPSIYRTVEVRRKE